MLSNGRALCHQNFCPSINVHVLSLALCISISLIPKLPRCSEIAAPRWLSFPARHVVWNKGIYANRVCVVAISADVSMSRVSGGMRESRGQQKSHPPDSLENGAARETAPQEGCGAGRQNRWGIAAAQTVGTQHPALRAVVGLPYLNTLNSLPTNILSGTRNAPLIYGATPQTPASFTRFLSRPST